MSSSTLEVTLAESRYDRQQRLTWWDQERLARARVVVVGAGALGNEVVKNLVLVGVGNIVVIDGDVIEASNLARCVFFRAEDEGSEKATVLAGRSNDLNPDAEVTAIVGDIRSFGTGLALRADVIVGALDNREARLYCNRLAARAGKSWVDGAIEALSGVARVFTPPLVCYECTLTESDWQALAHRQSCRLLSRDDLESGKVPTTASTASIVAGIQSQEVVKLLHRDSPGVRPLFGAVVCDGANNDFYPLEYPRDEDCLAHHHFRAPIIVDVDMTRFATLTFGDVAARAWPESRDDNSPVVVELGNDHVTAWQCTRCGGTEPDGRPAALINFGEALCPKCQEPRQPEFATSVDVTGDLARKSIASYGVRFDEILAVRSGYEERYVWLSTRDPRIPTTWTSHITPDHSRP